MSRDDRRSIGNDFPVGRSSSDEEEDDDFLTLSLSSFPSRKTVSVTTTEENNSEPPSVPPPPPPSPSTHAEAVPFLLHNSQLTQHSFMLTHSLEPLTVLAPAEIVQQSDFAGRVCQPSRPRARRNPSQSPREGKSETVPKLYPWATDRRATVHSVAYLYSWQIHTISGDVTCKRCERRYVLEYDLRRKFLEIGTFIAENKVQMHDRAPKSWMNPILPTCKFCEHENSLKPVIANKKKAINWLFLLLGQMLGCCSLEQLKYFCKHTKNHRTGAKDRVLYLTYLGLCKQLDADGPFTR